MFISHLNGNKKMVTPQTPYRARLTSMGNGIFGFTNYQDQDLTDGELKRKLTMTFESLREHTGTNPYDGQQVVVKVSDRSGLISGVELDNPLVSRG